MHFSKRLQPSLPSKGSSFSPGNSILVSFYRNSTDSTYLTKNYVTFMKFRKLFIFSLFHKSHVCYQCVISKDIWHKNPSLVIFCLLVAIVVYSRYNNKKTKLTWRAFNKSRISVKLLNFLITIRIVLVN